MAKIGNIEFRIGTKYPVPYQLYYTQKWKFEIRGIPEEFFDLTGCSNAGYQTEAELKKAIWEAIPKFHKLKEKQRLVIGYKAYATSELTMNKVREGSYSGYREGVSKKIKSFNGFGAPKCAVGIKYFVCMEIFNGKENEYFRVGEDHKVNHSHPMHFTAIDGVQFIDYTEGAIQFFEGITEAMKGMVTQMSTFFGLDAEKAALLIESNQKLLK